METAFEFILLETDNQHYCIICGCDISGETNVREHYYGKDHQDALEQYGSNIRDYGHHQYYCRLCDCDISGYTNVRNHLKGKQHQDWLNDSKPNDTESDYSDSDDSDDSDSVEYFPLDASDFIVYEFDTDGWYCFLCDYGTTNKWAMMQHEQTKYHKSDVKFYRRDIYGSETSWYRCCLCHCEISSYKDVYNHITGQEHGDSLFDYK